MSLVIEIPDETVEAMHLPVAEVEAELKKELALALFARGLLSLGKSVEWAGVPRQEFEELLARRRIERPYDSAELERDLAWAKKGS